MLTYPHRSFLVSKVQSPGTVGLVGGGAVVGGVGVVVTGAAMQEMF